MIAFGALGVPGSPGTMVPDVRLSHQIPDLVFPRLFIDSGSHFGSTFHVFSCFLHAIFAHDFRMDFSLFVGGLQDGRKIGDTRSTR